MTTVRYHDVEQGTKEWLECRRGLLTASGMKHLVTPKKKVTAKNPQSSAYIYERAAERITGIIDEGSVTDDMERGRCDEIFALALYAEHIAPLSACGFITNNKFGFTIGYSPDALVGDMGLVECKSRLPKHHVKTVVQGGVPDEFMIQIQTGLLVSERRWCDFVSFAQGMALHCVRVFPDEDIQKAIFVAAAHAECVIDILVDRYRELTADAIIAPRVTTV